MIDKLLQMDLESLKLGLLSSNKFWNKKLIIFNTASLCGFTKQLSDFQKIFIDGLAVPIAIPTNDFGKQEPGDDYEILQFFIQTILDFVNNHTCFFMLVFHFLGSYEPIIYLVLLALGLGLKQLILHSQHSSDGSLSSSSQSLLYLSITLFKG